MDQSEADNDLRDESNQYELGSSNSIGARPDLIILGVGHSGTSILAKTLFTLGWQRNDADEVFCESVRMREINDLHRSGGDSQETLELALEYLSQIASPFALKDPRLVFTLPLWIKAFGSLKRTPALLRITRERDQLAKSYLDRGEVTDGHPGMYGLRLDQLMQHADANFNRWPFAKMSIRYEDMVAAAALLKSERAMRPQGGLWRVTDEPGTPAA